MAKSNTGFFRVSKIKEPSVLQGYRYAYQMKNELLKMDIRSVSILDLKKKVEQRGLLWGIVEMNKAIHTANENHVGIEELVGRYGLTENEITNELENENEIAIGNEIANENGNEIAIENENEEPIRNENEHGNEHTHKKRRKHRLQNKMRRKNMPTEDELNQLKNNTVTYELINQTLGEKYTEPYCYIKRKLNHTLTCTGLEYKKAVETATDEDILPHHNIKIICDGVLAYIYSDELEKVGLDLLTYYTYRFKPSDRFIKAISKFKYNLLSKNIISGKLK